MNVRAEITLALNDEIVACYCRYHKLDVTKRREVASHIRQTLIDDGYSGFSEQVHEGRQSLAHEGWPL